MKKILTILIIMTSAFASIAQAPLTSQGAINAYFSVGENKYVMFSRGNLQYNAALGTHECADSTSQQGTWRFAEEQYEVRLEENLNRSATYDGWIDLFHYGASGYDGLVPYTKRTISFGDTIYEQIGVLEGSYYDFGIYNAISNGGNLPGLWRLFTIQEWQYMLTKRPNASSLCGLAQVNGVYGAVFLPDNCNLNELKNVTTFKTNYEVNVYSLAAWRKIESFGAVFLPIGNSIRAYNENEFYFYSSEMGFYLTSNKITYLLACVGFTLETIWSSVNPASQYISVRLVQDIDIYKLSLSANNASWGEVIGDSIYCTTPITVTAKPNEGYHFVQWSDGVIENPRTLTLTSDSTIIAEFAPNRYSISINCNPEEGIVKGDTGSFAYLSEHIYEAVANYGYTFAQWSDGVTDNPRNIILTQDTVITAQYNINHYPVIFLDYNSTVLSEQNIAFNSAAKSPSISEREGYSFIGWNVDIEHIKAPTYVIAQYEQLGIQITYKSEDGVVIANEYANIHIPEAPNITGKSFAGWLTETVDDEFGIVLRATYTTDNPTANLDVIIEPSATTAVVTFPYITGAVTYMLIVRDLSGHIICKMMFSSTGHLLGIALAPGRKQTQQENQSTGFQFTIEGLDSSTTYEYEFVAHDECDDVIKILIGSFTTTTETPTYLENTVSNLSPKKVIRKGQMYILLDDKTYSIMGQEVGN
jgi:hypothetical protein